MGDLRAVLALEDGSKFHGFGFGFPCEVSGEVVFNTGMTGYIEALTDPSYSGEILMQTYPLIGNYGVPSKNSRDRFGLPSFFESKGIQVNGYIVQSISDNPSHWMCARTLEDWLFDEGVPGIAGIDTRKLTKKLRAKGAMLGILKVDEEFDMNEIEAHLSEIPDPSEIDLVKDVTIGKPVHHRGSGPTIVIIDCGVKFSIIRSLLARDIDVVRVPYDYPVEGILEFDPSGVLISNGPGEPKMCKESIHLVGELMEVGLPMMGICLGNQLLALASGGDTYKMKFGHRGQNHPCTDLSDGRCYITSQNHGFTIESESLKGTGFKVSYVNANDGTVEGIRHQDKPIFGVQFHPEGSPGPTDTDFLFNRFLSEVR